MILSVFWTILSCLSTSFVQATILCDLRITDRSMVMVSMEDGSPQGDESYTYSTLEVACEDVYKDPEGKDVAKPWPLYVRNCKHGFSWNSDLQACTSCPDPENPPPGVEQGETFYGCENQPNSCRCHKGVPRSMHGHTWDEHVQFTVNKTIACKPKAVEPDECTYLSVRGETAGESMITPSLNCTGITFDPMPADMARVYAMPATKKDAVEVMFRQMFSYGFETQEEIYNSVEWSNSVAQTLFLATSNKQGNKIKLGPNLQEMQSFCMVTLNIFTGWDGSAINSNKPINMSDIPVHSPKCAADRMAEAKKKVQNIQEKITNVTENSARCNNSDPHMGMKRRLGGKVTSDDVLRSWKERGMTPPIEHDNAWAQAFRRQRAEEQARRLNQDPFEVFRRLRPLALARRREERRRLHVDGRRLQGSPSPSPSPSRELSGEPSPSPEMPDGPPPDGPPPGCEPGSFCAKSCMPYAYCAKLETANATCDTVDENCDQCQKCIMMDKPPDWNGDKPPDGWNHTKPPDGWGNDTWKNDTGLPGCDAAHCDQHCGALGHCLTTPDDKCKGPLFDECMEKCGGCGGEPPKPGEPPMPGDPGDGKGGEKKRADWEIYEGMSCGQKRGIVEQTMMTGMQRAFALFAGDAITGCKGIVDQWAVYGDHTFYQVTDACVHPHRSSDGNYNPNWINDPCCNWAKRNQQCCAPKNISRSMTVIKSFNEDKMAEYAALTNTSNLVMGIAYGYQTAVQQAATKCFTPFADAWKALKETWKVVDTCYQAVEGAWNSQLNVMVGSPCNADSECWTLSCKKPPASTMGGSTGGSSGNSNQKYCALPSNTPSKDYATPVVRCIVSTAPADVKSYFAFKFLKLSAKATATQIAQKLAQQEGMVSSECRGMGHGSWGITNETQCLSQKRCSWTWSQNMAASECLNPCTGGSCPYYCGSDELPFQEMSNFPGCYPENQHHHDPSEKQCWQVRQEAEMAAQGECDQCRMACENKMEHDDTCWSECDRTLCDFGKIGEEAEKTCRNDKCKKFKDENGTEAADNNRHECIFPHMSYSPDKKAACESECHISGPRPKAPKRCYAVLNVSMPNQKSCWELFREGWIEDRHAMIHHWDWSRGPPPIEYCLLKQFRVVDGQPYREPPRYGPNCKESCAEKIDMCVHPPEQHKPEWHEFCYEIFNDFRDAWYRCRDTDQGHRSVCSGSNCWKTRDSYCLEWTNLTKNATFMKLGCDKGSSEWMNHETMVYTCAKNIDDPECRWNDTKMDQPCSMGCLHETCHSEMQACVATTGNETKCYGDTLDKSYCRECWHLLPCDDWQCKNPCNQMENGRAPKERCAGCPAKAPFQCYPNAACYDRSDKNCWPNEHYEFGENCPSFCDTIIHSCRDRRYQICEYEQKRKCDVKFWNKSQAFWQCHEADRQAVNHNESVMTRLWNIQSKMNCSEELGLFTGDLAFCKECDGDWNEHQLWELSQADKCMNGTTKFKMHGSELEVTMPSSCSACNPISCPELTKDCWGKISRAQGCRHEHGGKFCKISKTDGFLSVLQTEPSCVGCYHKTPKCEDRCKYEECRYFGWAGSPYEECSGCGQDKMCNPSSDCFFTTVHGDVIDTWNDTVFQAKAQEFRAKVEQCGMHYRRLASDEKPDAAMPRFEEQASEQEARQEEDADWRRLNRFVNPVDTEVSCTGKDCGNKEALCNAYFDNAPTEAKKLVAAVKFELPPWESESQICDEMGRICYMDYDTALAMIQNNVPMSDWCSHHQEDPNHPTDCSGCATGDKMTCPHHCQCQQQYTFDARMLHEGGRAFVCQLHWEIAAKQAAADRGETDAHAWHRAHEWIDHISWDDRLFQGEGGCKQHISTWRLVPEKCHHAGHECWEDPQCAAECTEPQPSHSMCPDQTNWKFYAKTRYWREGEQATSATCEAESCYPSAWIRNKEECVESDHSSYCWGADCPYCDTANYWDWQNSQSKVLCQLVKASGGGSLTKAECQASCGGNFSTTCKFVGSLCITPAPPAPTPAPGASTSGSDTTSSNDITQTCVETNTKTFTVNSQSRIAKHKLLRCKDFSIDQCPWAKDAIPELECETHRMPCKTKEDCNSAGRCEIHMDEWQAQQAGGFCVLPFEFPTTLEGWNPDTARHPHEVCSSKQVSGYRFEGRQYGCLAQKDGSAGGGTPGMPGTPGDNTSTMPDPGMKRLLWEMGEARMTPSDCTGLGGRFFKYPWKEADCVSSGWAWAANALDAGTMMCCISAHGWGDSKECHEFSMDSTEASCSACGGEWMSMFRWQQTGRWVQGEWKKAYTWKERELQSLNDWVTTLQHWKFGMLWDTAVSQVRSRPVNNYINCRLSGVASALEAIAAGEFKALKLADALVLPGEAATTEAGGFRVSTDENTNTGTESKEISIGMEPADTVIGSSNSTEVARLLQAWQSGRRLAAGEGNIEDGALFSESEWDKAEEVERRLATGVEDLPASCYTVVKASQKYVGQLVGDCLQFTPTTALDGEVQICAPINTQIQQNPEFTRDGFGSKSTSLVTALSVTVTRSSNQLNLCTRVKDAGTYCPVRLHSDFDPATPSSADSLTSADNSCGAVEAVTAQIATKTTVLKDSGFKGDGSIAFTGTDTTSSTDSDTSTLTGGGSKFAVSGQVSNVAAFVETAEKATTITTTNPTTTDGPAPTPAPTPPPTPPPGADPVPTPAPTPQPAQVIVTSLAGSASAGDSQIAVADTTGLAAGMTLEISEGSKSESFTIISVSTSRRLSGRRLAPGTVTLDRALSLSYTSGATVTVTPAQGNQGTASSSTSPSTTAVTTMVILLNFSTTTAWTTRRPIGRTATTSSTTRSAAFSTVTTMGVIALTTLTSLFKSSSSTTSEY